MINKALGILENASEHGPQVDFLLEIVHWFMLILFVGWSIFFVYALIRFRKSKNPKADYVGVASHRSTYIEIGVVVAEAVLLLGFAFPLWAKRVNEFPTGKDVVEVWVTAQQFTWNISYPGPDRVFGKRGFSFVRAGNLLGLDPNDPKGKDDIEAPEKDLHLPVNKSAIIHLTSKDVIHSFTVRQMRITQDAIPGMSIPTWFKPIKEGTYEIACAQLCGNGHHTMKGILTVESEEKFNKWLKEQAASGGPASYE